MSSVLTLSGSLLGLLISGCAVEPIPFTRGEFTAITQSDHEIMRNGIPPITTALTIEEVIARALKYNLDHRTRMLEQALATGQLDAGKYDLLPRLMADAGYEWRDKENIRLSTDSVTGLPSLANPSISSEKQHFTSDIGLTWNILDFGASYYTARQNADRLLIADERRRKAMHTLIQNVRTAFWRVAAADKWEEQVKDTIKIAEAALIDSRRIEEERVKSPNDSLRYQRNLLENLRLLESVDRELASAHIELAGLIGASPGSRINIIEPTSPKPLSLDMPVDRMEEIAMINNPDLREQIYNVRIAATETRKTLLKLLPGLSFDYEYKYDNDKYLINQEWMNAGLRVGFNLFNLLSAPSQMNLAEVGVKLAENRRMALQMTVLVQLHLARFQYVDALRQYQRAVDIADVDNRLAQLVLSQAQSEMSSKLDHISAKVTSILSSVRQYQAMAKVQETASKVQSTLGVEPHISDVNGIDLPELMEQIGLFLKGWTPNDLPTAKAEIPAG